MDPKLFKMIELAFMAALLAAVLYLGGLLGNGEAPIPPAPRTPAVSEPLPTSPPAGTSAPTPHAHTPRSEATLTATPAPLSYRINAGDTCLAIAVKFDISLESLRLANQLNDECLILAGDELKIPPLTPTIAP